MELKTVTLVLSHFWFDQIAAGFKTVEYRQRCHKWQKQIIEKKPQKVVFLKGYSAVKIECMIEKIDIGPCPYIGWSGDFIRIHFTKLSKGESKTIYQPEL